MYKHSLIFIIGMVVSVLSNAAQKLYKWTDEKGNIHYSDKKPTDLLSADEVTLTSALPFELEETPAPANLGDEIQSHVWLYFSSPVVNLRALGRQDIGKYFFGPDCVSPTAIRADRMIAQSQHSAVIPNSRELTKSIALYFKKLNYPISSSSASSLKTDLNLKQGLVLRAQVTDFKLHLCAPKKTTQYFGNYKRNRAEIPEAERLKVFNKQRGMVDIKWSLMDSNGESVLFEMSFRGVANEWSQASYYYIGFLNAVRDSARQIARNGKFLQIMNEHESAQKNESVESQGFLGWVMDGLSIARYTKRAQFAKAMSYASRLRIQTVEHYLYKGAWPNNEIFQTYLDNDGVLVDNSIEGITIASDGSLLIYLDRDSFGKDMYFSLRPTVNNHQVNWKCESNLPSNIARSVSCEGSH